PPRRGDRRRPRAHRHQGEEQRGHGLDRPGGGHRRARRGHPRGRPLIQDLLGWLAGLPPAAIYAVLGLLALLESVIPPLPADVAAALGAFLGARGVLRPGLVLVVVVVANVAGAAAVYVVAHGP